MTWTFERISYAELKVTANDRDGNGQFSTVLDLPVGSAISAFRLYASQMDTGDNRRSFYDNFIVSDAPATIAVSPGSVSGLTTYAGYPSNSQGIILNAENLTQALIVTAPWGFVVSSDNSYFSSSVAISPAGGLVSSTIYVRIAENASVGYASGNLTLASYGATEFSVPLSGTVSSGYSEGYSAGYTAGFADGSGGGAGYEQGFSDGVAHLTGNATIAASHGLYSTDAIMDMNLGGLVIQSTGGGNATLRLQLQSTPNLATQPFQNDGAPIQIPIQMNGSKGFLRVRALGPQ
jgi:hypothetical protein